MQKKFSKKRTPFFQKNVYRIVKEIPAGRFLTYKEVARLAGFPGAWRAVGNVLNKNRDPRIPCHRVIRSDMRVGGYNRGVKKKLTLLRSEGVLIKKRKVIK